MHQKLRKEKNCLNCGQAVADRFCTHCGQENLELHESSWHLFAHYFQDLVHYDGKFWHTLKNLFTKPGFVPKEYIEGRRVSNLRPVQLYVFASTVFFIVFFLIGPKLNINKPNIDDGVRRYQAQKLSEVFKSTPLQQKADSFYSDYKKVEGEQSQVEHLADSVAHLKEMISLQEELKQEGVNISLDSLLKRDSGNAKKYKKKYTSLDNGWLDKNIDRVIKRKNEEYNGDDRKFAQGMVTEFLHNLSKVFFLSLPFFAFFLWITHRSKTKKYYTQHLILALYHYSYVFIISLIALCITYLLKLVMPADSADTISGWLFAITFFYLLIYLGFSMKRFYGQSLRRAFAKEILVLFLSGIIMFLLLLLLAGYLVLH